ncbi:MAG: hypothetical protein H6828_01365 [Planctomycetes bacterium]|nr:hypothetical protein [Planctomycetota bacterium]
MTRLVLRSVGWLAVLVALCALVLELSGAPQRWLRRELAQRLEAYGSSVSFDDVSVDWLGPGVTLEGFSLEKAGVRHLEARRLYVALEPSIAHGLRLARLDLDDGALRVRASLLEDVRALLELREREAAPTAARPQELTLPSVQVRGFRVEADDEAGRTHDLGSIDFSMVAVRGRPARLNGRLSLACRASADSPCELYLHGVAGRGGDIELFGSAKDVALEDWSAPDFAMFAPWIAMQPRGRLTLEARARLDLLGDATPELELRVDVEDARLQPPDGLAPLEDLGVRLALDYDPAAGGEIDELASWRGGGAFSAGWAEQRFEGGLRLGRSARPGTLLESWVHAPRVDVEAPGLLALKPRALLIRNLFDSLRPQGAVDAEVAFAFRDGWTPGAALAPYLEYAVRVVPRGELSGAWSGWVLPEEPDLIPLAFPMPASAQRGAVLFARNARFPRRALLDVDFTVRHAAGDGRVTYQMWTNRIDMPPFAPGYGREESDLVVRVPRLLLDERTAEYMQGLRQVPELATLFDDYGIAGGEAEAALRVSTRAQRPEPMVDVQVRVRDVDAAWAELPVPVRDLRGSVHVIEDGRGTGEVSYEMAGTSASAPELRLRGRQRHSGPVGQRGVPRALELDVLALEARDVDVLGDDFQVLAEHQPEVAQAVAEFDPRGRADVALSSAFDGVRPRRGALEVTPRPGMTLLPRAFPVETHDVRGRVLVELVEDGAEVTTTTRVAPLAGAWNDEVEVSLMATFPSAAPARGVVRAAGLRPDDAALRGKLAVAMETDPARVEAEIGELGLSGVVEAEHEFELPLEADAPQRGAHTFHLRDNTLRQPGGLVLEDLGGTLRFEDGVLSADVVRATLERTAIALRDLRVTSGEAGLALDADLDAERLALARPLLRQFLDEATVATLVDEFDFRGAVDLAAARLALRREPDGELEVMLSGNGTLSDVYAAVGLPVTIRSAHFDLEEFVLSGGELRTWGRVSDLYGLVLDRDLSQASMLLSYYGSRFSVETLEGALCHGRIGAARQDESSTELVRPVFSVDLRPPYAFQTGLAIQNLDVGLLLEDVFASNLANKGQASGELRLSGELADLLSITGRGWGEVRDSVLWSVPVLRDLFTQLGYDATAVFDDMSARFRVQDGVILMEDMVVHSPLLNLSGRGTLGLDGALHHDLQVKYALMDKAGPLGSLIHLLQNTLLSVAIRGDMERPRVFLRGALTGPFQGVDEHWRALPLPGYSSLPPRF